MTKEEILAKVADVKPGTWGVNVTYKSPIKLTAKSIKAGLDQSKFYKITKRMCRINIDYHNTKRFKELEAERQAKIAAGETVKELPSYFEHSDIPEENGIIVYNKLTHKPAIALFAGGAEGSRETVRYFINDEEVPYEDVVECYENKAITADVLKTTVKTGEEKSKDRTTFTLYCDKILDITIGKFSEN